MGGGRRSGRRDARVHGPGRSDLEDTVGAPVARRVPLRGRALLRPHLREPRGCAPRRHRRAPRRRVDPRARRPRAVPGGRSDRVRRLRRRRHRRVLDDRGARHPRRRRPRGRRRGQRVRRIPREVPHRRRDRSRAPRHPQAGAPRCERRRRARPRPREGPFPLRPVSTPTRGRGRTPHAGEAPAALRRPRQGVPPPRDGAGGRRPADALGRHPLDRSARPHSGRRHRRPARGRGRGRRIREFRHRGRARRDVGVPAPVGRRGRARRPARERRPGALDVGRDDARRHDPPRRRGRGSGRRHRASRGAAPRRVGSRDADRRHRADRRRDARRLRLARARPRRALGPPRRCEGPAADARAAARHR